MKIFYQKNHRMGNQRSKNSLAVILYLNISPHFSRGDRGGATSAAKKKIKNKDKSANLGNY
jgi:hypothetical protein